MTIMTKNDIIEFEVSRWDRCLLIHQSDEGQCRFALHVDDGCVLVFVDTQEACDNLFKELLKQNLPCATLHGGMGQDDRDSTLADFKTGDIGLLRIVREEGPSSGVRRIEAVTGLAALDYIRTRDAQLERAAAVLKTAPATLAERVEALSTERRQLEKELADVRKKLAAAGSGGGGAVGASSMRSGADCCTVVASRAARCLEPIRSP